LGYLAPWPFFSFQAGNTFWSGSTVMRKIAFGMAALVVLLCLGRAVQAGGADVPPVLKFKMTSLDGKEVNLADYQGKVVLFVNVASKCGYTPQYKGLEALHEKYAKDGLVIIGVPSNDFGGQEPGTNQQIAEFCSATYGVKFPMMSKVPVKGADQTPLYKFLTSKETNPNSAGPIKWNFTKFLIGKDGQIVARFESAVKPDSENMTKAIETELKK
jgi:glutathione peroxidase